jgi:hypothetical protein
VDYSFSKDFETIVVLAAVAGAAGGFAWDIANPVRRFSKNPPIGLENRITFPKLFSARGTRGLDLGFLGPLIIGALAGIVAVLVAGRSGPGGEDVVRELANLATAGANDPEAAEKAEEALATGINKTTLYPLALLGGIAGWALLQALASRLSSLFEVVLNQSGKAASVAAEKAVEAEGEERGVEAETRTAIAAAARKAVAEAAVSSSSA